MPGTSTITRPASGDQLKVHIYIDNSNLWLQGQRTYAKKMNLRVNLDPTWRCSVVDLKEILTAHSRLHVDTDIDEIDVTVNLYGSTPHPVEAVWNGIESHNINVINSRRSSWTGREKEVDAKIITDIVDQAAEAYYMNIRSEFILVSGDRDMHFPVEKVATKYRLPVHVWSWNNGLASVYMEQHDPLVQVYSLDNYLEQIGFCESKFRVDRNVINPRSIVVLDPLPKADVVENFLSTWRIPTFRYEFAETCTSSFSGDLAIIPALAWRMTDDELDDVFQLAKTHLETHGLSVVTYAEYFQRYVRDSNAELMISNRFSELSQEACQGTDSNKEDDNDKDDSEDSFVAVDRYARQKKRRLQNDERKSRSQCIWGKYCKKGCDCKYGHTKSEEDSFKVFGPLPMKKFKFCQKPDCIRGAGCTYAHDKAELLCPTCGETGVGHEMDNCPRSPRNKRRW
ncbi:hypothetical protein G7Z17_g3711 [Cylindrodendrum hubeiense]|uniref:NYN domain-containing protein n=1 Tax=Cylindrodendrum hubeiense TaxID=595255 RepID=A0A9P5LAJ2_9HYPO|nr:hypothetical protein G7Z17_g3711 [Cylindrodendrum hubeiense]